MRGEERLFLAIGGADPALLERSERRRRPAVLRWGGLAAAACVAVVCLLAVHMGRSAAPPDEGADALVPPEQVRQNPEVLALTGGDIGALHLVAVHYGPERDEAGENFILYINEESYCGTWEGEDYVVRPLFPPPEGMPACSLTVSHRRSVSLEAALSDVRQALAAEFDMVEDQSAPEGRAALVAWVGDASGAAWDAANAGVTLVSDGQGGVFVLTARYFTEAAEGHGAHFADMMSAFRPVPADVVVPAWMESLRQTVDTLLPALFSDAWSPEARALLAEDAWVQLYGEDVSGDVSIAGVDISTDSDQDPLSAVVSVRHRISTEDSMNCVTMELERQGESWLAGFIGLEK